MAGFVVGTAMLRTDSRMICLIVRRKAFLNSLVLLFQTQKKILTMIARKINAKLTYWTTGTLFPSVSESRQAFECIAGESVPR